MAAKRQLDEEELKRGLETCNLSLNEACIAIEQYTEVFLSPSHVRTQLDRYGQLSNYATAAFRLLFMRFTDERRKN